MTSIWYDLTRNFREGNMITRLILINIGVFIFIHLLGAVILQGNYSFMNWLMVPSEGMELLTRPWTVITYMFLHQDFWHLVFNMLVLYYFSSILGELGGDRRVLPIYIMGGLVGFVAFFLFANLPLPIADMVGGRMLGASAGVLALMVAATMLYADYEIRLLLLGKVKLKYLTAFLLFMDFLAIRAGSNTGGHIAHLGGALLGAFIILQIRKGIDYTIGFNDFLQKINIFQPNKTPSYQRPKRSQKPRQASKRNVRVAFSNPDKSKAGQRAPKYDANRQAQIDAILDKIKASGYENLTAEEKDFLFNASKDDK